MTSDHQPILDGMDIIVKQGGTPILPAIEYSTGGARWEEISSRYKALCEWRYGEAQAVEHWKAYEPVYRYGWEMLNRPEFRGRTWDEAEQDLRHDWEARHPELSWDSACLVLRDVWDYDSFQDLWSELGRTGANGPDTNQTQ